MVTDEMVEAAIVANTRAKLFGGEPRDWVRAALEAALSAVKPVRCRDCDGYNCDDGCAYPGARPAPSVAVKALEWVEGDPGTYTEIAESPFGHYSVWEINGTACWSPWKQGYGSIAEGGLAGAKAAAQADYEARILSALSAQVQDVAGVSPVDYMRRHDAAIAAYEANTPNDYRYSALALRKAVDAAFAVAAAPAKQEGGTNE